jgi:hypothetical protein
MSDKKRNREERTGPIGTIVGATLGPLGAAVGTVVDEDRFAFKLSVGTDADEGGGMADATTIEIEDEETDAGNESEGAKSETDAEDAAGEEAEETADS